MAGRVLDVFEAHQHLLGRSPVLRWTEFTPEPWKLYASVTLTATDRPAAAENVVFVMNADC